MPDQHEPVVSEAVAVFHDVSDLEAAVEELRAAGFGKHDISLLASEHAVNRKLGHRYERVEDLEDDPAAPRVAYRTRASLGDSEDLLIGSLTYLPTVVAAGTVVASAGLVLLPPCNWHRDRRGADRHSPCPLAGQEPRRAPAGTAGPRRSAALGADARCRQAAPRPRHFEAALGARRAHSSAAGRRQAATVTAPQARWRAARSVGQDAYGHEESQAGN